MRFTSGTYNDTLNYLLYVCKARIYPNGRLLQYTYPQGHTSYWFHRLRIVLQFNSCSDVLTIGFIPEDLTQHDLSEETVNLTCHDSFPRIVDSKHRIVSLSWFVGPGAHDTIGSQVDVEVSSYMRFDGDFGIAEKTQLCERASGFWCGNQSAMCIYGQMRCDQADGCFDGGTDELGCPPPRNYTTAPIRRTVSDWSTYLPWTGLSLLPIILIFVLGLICTPRKSLDDFDSTEVGPLKIYSMDSNSSSTSASTASLATRCGSVRSLSLSASSTSTKQKAYLYIRPYSSNPDLLLVNGRLKDNSSTQFPEIPDRRPKLRSLLQDSTQVSYTTSRFCPRSINSGIPAKLSKIDPQRTGFIQYNARINQQLIPNDVEDKLFASPVDFEMAALNIQRGKDHQLYGRKHKSNKQNPFESDRFANKNDRHKQTNSFRSTYSNSQSSTKGILDTAKDFVNNKSDSSHESDMEDVTPFGLPHLDTVRNQHGRSESKRAANGVPRPVRIHPLEG